MAKNFSKRLTIWLSFSAFLSISFFGCTKEESDSLRQAETNQSVEADVQLTPDQACALEMRACLDKGENAMALALARKLYRSPAKDVRLMVVNVLSWVGGKRIQPELVEMMNDEDGDVANLALSEWTNAYGNLAYDSLKASAITNAAVRVTSETAMREILMHMVDIELVSALPALEGVIVGWRGKAVSTCAKDAFMMRAGEPWSSPERTGKILANLKE